LASNLTINLSTSIQSMEQMAREIVEAHRDTLALAASASPRVIFTADDLTYRAAKLACHRLGFIDSDAQVVSLAWQQQTLRTGNFEADRWPCEPGDFGIAPWPRPGAFAPCPKHLRLYAVVPDAAWVGRMARAGVPTVQLRFKLDGAASIKREVRAAVKAVQGTGALLFINDHWRAAISAGAYGVHLGQEDMDVADLAAIRDAGLRLGLSSHGYAEMIKADAFSPSYIAMGAVYPTTLKRMVTPPQGLGRLRAYARLMRGYPLVAIGGIDESRLDDVLASGVGSVAMVRALVASSDPAASANALMRRIDSACFQKDNTDAESGPQ
jgi:thiamine-phosphate pyrophosphorylase